MEPITTTAIISTLAAGALAASKDVGKQAVKDAYVGLKAAIKKWFEKKAKTEGEMVLEQHEKDPDTWEKPLEKSLTDTEAAKAPEVIDAVALLKQALESSSEGRKIISKYNLNIQNSEVGIIGDRAKVGKIDFGKK